VLILTAWTATILIDSGARPASRDGLTLSLPALAILGIGAIVFFAWDGSVISRQVRQSAQRELEAIRVMRAELEAEIKKDESREGQDTSREDGRAPENHTA